MMHTSETIHVARIQASRKLFGHAVSYRPQEVYEAIGSPDPDKLARLATLQLLASARILKIVKYVEQDGVDGSTYLRAGISDTQKIYTSVLQHRPETAFDTALAITTDPRSTTALAHLALRQEGLPPKKGDNDGYDPNHLNEIITRRTQASAHSPQALLDYDIDDANTHLFVNRDATPTQPKGCPFAGHNQEVAPDPLFVRFAGWAGQLAVRSIYDHK